MKSREDLSTEPPSGRRGSLRDLGVALAALLIAAAAAAVGGLLGGPELVALIGLAMVVAFFKHRRSRNLRGALAFAGIFVCALGVFARLFALIL